LSVPISARKVERDAVDDQLAGLDLGQVEDVGQDRRQRVGRIADLLDVLQASPVVDLGRARKLRQPHQRVQRRTDLVAGIGQERALGAVGGLGLVACACQRLLDDAAIGDVLGQPDRAAGGLRRIERLGEQAAGEGAAVASHHRHFEIDRLSTRQRRVHCLGHRVERLVRRPHHALLLVLQCAARPAEHLVEARIGHHDAAVARERDAYQRVLEDRLALAPRLLAGGDVARAGHLVFDIVDREARGRHQHRDAAPIARGHRGREVLHALLLIEHAVDSIALRGVGPQPQLAGRAADHILGTVAGGGQEGRVDHRVAAAGELGERDPVGAGGHEVRQQRLAASHQVFGGAALGVVGDDGQRGDLAVDVHAHAAHAHAQQAVGARLQREFSFWQAFAGGQGFQPLHVFRGAFARRPGLEQSDQVLAQQRAQVGEAEQRDTCRIGIEHPPFAVQHQRRGNAAEQILVARLGGPQRLARLHVLRDVAQHAPVARELAGLAGARLGAEREVAHPARHVVPAQRHVAHRQARRQFRAQGLQHLRVERDAARLPQQLAHAGVHAMPAQADEVAQFLLGAEPDQAAGAVHLPVRVRGHRQQPEEAALTLVGAAQRAIERAPQQFASAERDAQHQRVREQRTHEIQGRVAERNARRRQPVERHRHGQQQQHARADACREDAGAQAAHHGEQAQEDADDGQRRRHQAFAGHRRGHTGQADGSADHIRQRARLPVGPGVAPQRERDAAEPEKRGGQRQPRYPVERVTEAQEHQRRRERDPRRRGQQVARQRLAQAVPGLLVRRWFSHRCSYWRPVSARPPYP
jgi:hypothetical protein